MHDNLINSLKDLIIKSGLIALDIKKSGIEINNKNDGSPVTNADKAISTLIYTTLQNLTPEITIICEEQPIHKLNSDTFWLIDPIDGTKSYISDKDTYTINIGLIKNGTPTIGLIYQPANNKLYYTDKYNNLRIEQNSVELSVNNAAQLNSQRFTQDEFEEEHTQYISIRERKQMPQNSLISDFVNNGADNTFNAVVSSHYSGKIINEFLSKYSINKIEAIASSIKLCLIAEGKADIFPKFGKTMEWDIAAGHALIKASGGNIFSIDGSNITYGKANFNNPNFCAYSSYWLQKQKNIA